MDESQINIAVSLILRDTETCLAAAEVWDESQISTVEEPRDQRRVLAVVSHLHDPSSEEQIVAEKDDEEPIRQQEEGCLFVMKYKSPSSLELHPDRLIPIVPDFTASLKQANDGTSSLNASEFQLILGLPKGMVTFGSNQMHSLSAVLEEIRRLKKLTGSAQGLVPHPTASSDSNFPNNPEGLEPTVDLSEVPTDQPDNLHQRHWEWLHFYLSHKASRILPSQKPKPHDIRAILNGPKFSGSSAGLSENEDEDMGLIRDEWVRRQLLVLKSEYSKTNDIRLRIGTFNVNGKSPSQKLTSWLWPAFSSDSTPDTEPTSSENVSAAPESEIPGDVGEPTPGPTKLDNSPSVEVEAELPIADSISTIGSTVPSSIVTSSEDHPTPSTPPSSVLSEHNEDLPDIFVLGFQELDLSAEALIYNTSTLKTDTWIKALFEALGKHADKYVQLAYKQLVGVLVVVIIRREIQSMVKEISTGSTGVGIMGFLGNKGATAVRLRLNSTTLTFVCSHLAAFDDYAEKRNSDFAELCRKLRFPITWKGPRSMSSLTSNIWETDVLFWLGDLNYRIDLPDKEVRTLLNTKPLGHENNTLLAHDQLKLAARHKRAFIDFIEHDITFLPTYRFGDFSTDELGYDLKRRPAWTDRILYLAADSNIVLQTSYQDHPDITFSDHKPVSADFSLQIESHDPHELHRAATSIFHKLGDFEDFEEIPKVSLLDSAEVHLGPVSYPHSVSRTIRVKNEGTVACAFRFLPLEAGAPISKEWLKVEPTCGILLVGETGTITLTITIDKRAASFLNHGNTKLEDDLIFHLIKGTDHVISVSGSYQPTCFANSLAWLVRSPGPIREQGNAQLLPEANTLSSPRELMFLVEWLITNAQDITDLFVTPGDEFLVALIREHLDTQHLDTGKDVVFPEGTDHRAISLAFAETLLQFLDSLIEPVIPWVLHPRCALAVDRDDVFEILDDVPAFARNVYVTITAFLHFIACNGEPERASELAKSFANVLLRDDPRATGGVPSLTPLGKRNFLLYAIS